MVAIVEMQSSSAGGRQGSLPHRDYLIDALAELGQVSKEAVMSELSIQPVALLLKRCPLPEMSRQRGEHSGDQAYAARHGDSDNGDGVVLRRQEGRA